MISERPFLVLALIITSTILSVYLGFAYGLLGVAVAYYWFWIVCALEGLRILKILPKKSFDKTTEETRTAMEEAVEMLENNYD